MNRKKKTEFSWRLQIKTSLAISIKIRTTRLLFTTIINGQHCFGFSLQCDNRKKDKQGIQEL